MALSRSVTARSAKEFAQVAYDSMKVLNHDLIISTKFPALIATVIDGFNTHSPIKGEVFRNDKYSMPAVVDFITTKRPVGTRRVTIVPKSIQVGLNLPSYTTRIIVDDAGIFLGDILIELELMREGCKK